MVFSALGVIFLRASGRDEGVFRDCRAYIMSKEYCLRKNSNILRAKRLYLRRNYKKNHTYGGDIGDTSAVSMLKKVVTAVLSSTARASEEHFSRLHTPFPRKVFGNS